MDEIASRGQVKVNVYEEWVEITAGMGFAPRKEKQPPTAEWIDPASADAALRLVMQENVSPEVVVHERHD